MLQRGKMDRGVLEMLEPLYSEDTGWPSVDPVVLVKMVLIQHAIYTVPRPLSGDQLGEA